MFAESILVVSILVSFCLMASYYGIDMTSEEGMAMVDQLVHNYDISSGETTLDRSQAVAMPMHSFDELPIMKYDGWDDCPYEPEPDTFAKVCFVLFSF
jgi:hypothetical protein